MSKSKEAPPTPLALPGVGLVASPETLIPTEAEVSFRILFISHPEPMWVYDLKTLRCLEVNDAALDHYGYSRNEFLGMRVTDIRPLEEVPRLLEDVARSRAGVQHSGEWKHLLKDGRLIDVEVVSHELAGGGVKPR
jgi:PAS domain S-box-containing protein